MLWGLVVGPLLCVGLLSGVLMEVEKMQMKDGLCNAIPCVFGFPKAASSNFTTVGYRLKENISFPVSTNNPSATIDRDHVPRNLEEQGCTLRVHDILKRDNMTYILYADGGFRKGAVSRQNLALLVSDPSQKSELRVQESLVAGEPVTLTCTTQGTCREIQALFLSWKGPTLSSNTTESSDSSSSSKPHLTPQPEDGDTALRCHLNFSLDNQASSSRVKPLVVSPARMLNSSCTLKMTLSCSCSFHGVPRPSVEWWVGDAPVGVNNMGNFRVITTTLGPWANSTIHLRGEAEILLRLRCEGRNQYGVHTSGIFLVPGKNSVSGVFLKGLVQGLVYGSIASSLFYFFMVLLVVKTIKWWNENQTPKNKESLTLKKPASGGAKISPKV